MEIVGTKDESFLKMMIQTFRIQESYLSSVDKLINGKNKLNRIEIEIVSNCVRGILFGDRSILKFLESELEKIYKTN